VIKKNWRATVKCAYPQLLLIRQCFGAVYIFGRTYLFFQLIGFPRVDGTKVKLIQYNDLYWEAPRRAFILQSLDGRDGHHGAIVSPHTWNSIQYISFRRRSHWAEGRKHRRTPSTTSHYHPIIVGIRAFEDDN